MFKVKMLWLVCVLALMFGACGCQQISTVDPNYIKAVAVEVNDLVVRVDAYQAAANAALDSLVAAGGIDPNKAAKILAANADVDKLQATVKQVVAALQMADYPENGGLLTLIAAAQSANAATAPWDPYAGLIAAALTILSTILGFAVKKKSKEAIAMGLKYQAHKQGVEKTMKEVSLASSGAVKAVETMLYTNIGEARAALGVM